MRRASIALLTLAALALPAAALAHGGSQSPRNNASKVCKALRAEMGGELFRTTYGTNHNRHNAHGKCVSKHRRAVRGLIAQAVRECRAELTAEASVHRSGRGEDRRASRRDRRALRACVRAKLRTLLAERRAAFEAAAESCRTEQTADPDAFLVKYGKGEHKRHAFLRCVVQTVRANEAEAPS